MTQVNEEVTWRDAFRKVISDRYAMGLLFLFLGFNSLLASFGNLSVDEAHYALYASRLDWSYFDHPPLVGWVQWPAWYLGGQNFTMRLMPLFCWVMTALTIMTLTERLFPPVKRLRLPFWCHFISNKNVTTHTLPASRGLSAGSSDANRMMDPADKPRDVENTGWGEQLHKNKLTPAIRIDLLLFVFSPLLNILGIALMPDSLMMLLSCLVMALVWSLITTPLPSLKQWVGLGLLMGLAGLSKYTALMLGVSIFSVFFMKKGWRLLICPGAWVALLLAILLIAPVIYWNANHEWISMKYQFHHATGGGGWALKPLFIFMLLQCLCFGFLLPIGLLAAWRGRSLFMSAHPKISPLNFSLIFGLPLLLSVIWSSSRGHALPHWTASAWVILIPAAAWGCGELWRRQRRGFLWLGAFQGFSYLFMAVVLMIGGVGTEVGAQALSRAGELINQGPRNPIADLYGWEAAAQEARALAEQYHVATLAVMNWTMASRIAWYARPMPVKVVNFRHDQFEIWFRALQRGESVLLIDYSLMGFVKPVGQNQFKQCDWLAQRPVMHARRQISHFNFMLCSDWQGAAENNGVKS